MKLYICRHGETEDNIKGILQGHLPGKLTEKGISQAEKLSKRLKNIKFSVIYSSPLARALDTARIIGKNQDTEITLADELKEIDLGPWTGLHFSECNYDGPLPKRMETRESLLVRAKIIVDRAYSRYPNQTVLFVSHSGILRALITVILNKGEEFLKSMIDQKNTALNFFEIFEDKNHVVHLLNDDSHLD